MTDNVIQVRFQNVSNPADGYFKVMTERQADEYFHATDPDPAFPGCGGWEDKGVSPTLVGSNNMSNNAFQILTHHYVMRCGTVEAWYVTIHPAF